MTVALIDTRDDALADELARLALLAAVPVCRVVPGEPRGFARLLLTDPAGLAAAPPGQPLVVVSTGSLDNATLSAALDSGARAALQLPADEARLVRLLVEASGETARGPLFAVVGATGGVGASTFAAALAVAPAERSAPGLLVDLDPWGGGADLLLGLEERPGPRWSALTEAQGRVSASALREALPSWDGVSVLSNDGVQVRPAALGAVGSAGIADAGRVVLDLPRTQLSLLAESALGVDLALVVVVDDVPGVAAARRLVPVLRPLARRAGLVLLRASGAVEPTMVERAVGLSVMARLPVDQRLSRRALRGVPGTPTRVVLDAARQVAAGWELVR